MDSSLSSMEQRFVLAEMIKASSVGIDELVMFVKSNGIIPDWMNMQLPLGRNMNHCVQFAEHVSISATSSISRPSSVSCNVPDLKRASDSPDQSTTINIAPKLHPITSPAGPVHATILPRPGQEAKILMSHLPDPRNVAPRQSPPNIIPRKRGRPSRVGKATREPRPILPQPPAPTPPQSRLGQNIPRPRPILPANIPLTLPSIYATSTHPQDGARNKKRRRAVSATDDARPRILAEEELVTLQTGCPLPSPKPTNIEAIPQPVPLEHISSETKAGPPRGVAESGPRVLP